jgi:hypothetical protein
MKIMNLNALLCTITYECKYHFNCSSNFQQNNMYTYTQHWEIMDNMFERFLIVLLCVMPFDNLVLMLFILFTYVVFWPDGGEQKMIFRS